jgi:hypothetical protein
MTDDLVKRLREPTKMTLAHMATLEEAAGALERLRVALGDVIRVYEKAYGNHGWELDEAINDARKALEASR